MALLDALFQPLEYASANQGLLSRIPEWMIQPGQSQGFPGAPAPVQAPAPGPTALPANSTPTSAIPPAAPAPSSGGLLGTLFGGGPASQIAAPQGDLGIGDRLSAGLSGFANSRGLLPALSNLIQGVTTGQRSDPQGMMLQQQRATFQALVGSGVPPAQAMAGALNPKLLETIAPAYFGGYKPINVKNALGGEDLLLQGPGGRITRPQIEGEGGGQGGLGGLSGPTLLAPGVKQYDPTLPADQYLAQFSPDVQAAIKSYINGDVMPTGNPRQLSISNAAKTFAQLYGQKAGIPVNDSLYALRRKMQTDLASSGNSSMGGILANGKSSFAHLAELSDKYVDLGNYNGPNIPGGGYAAYLGNLVGNSASDTTQKAKIAAANANAIRYGQESTKFYAGSGGGEAERLAALKSVSPETASSNEFAAFLENEKGLMLDRLRQKELQIRDTMGDSYLQQHPVFTPELQKEITKIDANIAKLRGEGGGASAQPQSGTPAISEGATATNPQTGQKIVFKGGQWVPVQ